MKLPNTKIGDILSVKLAENKKKYFQLIAFDLTQLNSDVIRAFDREYTMEESPLVTEIINDKVNFYAHCVTKFGIKFGLWEKVGNTPEVGKLDHILFRGSSDSGHKVGDEPVKVSSRWYIWRINDKDFTVVGKLKGENRQAEIGVVVNPHDIVDRMKTGKYNFFYPGFE